MSCQPPHSDVSVNVLGTLPVNWVRVVIISDAPRPLNDRLFLGRRNVTECNELEIPHKIYKMPLTAVCSISTVGEKVCPFNGFLKKFKMS